MFTSTPECDRFTIVYQSDHSLAPLLERIVAGTVVAKPVRKSIARVWQRFSGEADA